MFLKGPVYVRVWADDICNFHNRGTIIPCLGTCNVNVSIEIKSSHDFT